MEAVFWFSLLLVAYPYAIYPALLLTFNRLGRGRDSQVVATDEYEPLVSVILPVHNEARRIENKVRNLLALNYPRNKLQILVVGDACSDDTLERAHSVDVERVETIALAARSGKAGALNAGLERSRGEIVVFTDAAIMLEPESLRAILRPFGDPAVGCVSGEDHIEGAQTEGLYGRLELLLRREEAKLHSIAGASGCFYAQRRELCVPFLAGMAPDFLSVLVTVKNGKRALAQQEARGHMQATAASGDEFARKVRTFLRGITTLFSNLQMLNPLRGYARFTFILWSHKLARWLAPLFLLSCLISNWALSSSGFYLLLLSLQLALYAAAVAGFLFPRLAERISIVRLCHFFVLVNAAALKALVLWALGTRIEVWQPTRRPG